MPLQRPAFAQKLAFELIGLPSTVAEEKAHPPFHLPSGIDIFNHIIHIGSYKNAREDFLTAFEHIAERMKHEQPLQINRAASEKRVSLSTFPFRNQILH